MALRDDFERDGYLIVPGAVAQDTLDGVRRVCARAVGMFADAWFKEGWIADRCESEPFDKRYASLRAQHKAQFPDTWRRILVSPEVYALWQAPGILDVICALVGDEVVAHGVWNGRPREPKSPVQRIPWHQDAFYYPAWNSADGRLVTCWIPLVPVDERSGCLQLVPGSHLRGLLSPKLENGQLVVDPDEVAGEPLSVPLQPGDVLLFDALTLHRANDNVADYVRWNVDIRFGAATPAIVAKNPQGYVCRSSSGVEPYAVWATRYGGEFEYSADALAALLGVEGESVDEVVKAAGLSATELKTW